MDNTKTYRAKSKSVEAHELVTRSTIMTADGPVTGEVGDFVIARDHEEGSEKVFDAESQTWKPKVVEVYEVVKRNDFLAEYDVPTEVDKKAPKPINIEFPGGEDTSTSPGPSPKTVEANSHEAVEPTEEKKPKRSQPK